MLSCKIEEYPAYRIKVKGDRELLESIYDFFQSKKHVKFPEWWFGRRVWITNTVDVNLKEKIKNVCLL